MNEANRPTPEPTWITPEFLEFFCRTNNLLIGCGVSAEKLWISPYGFTGPAPRDRIGDILKQSSKFEVIPMSAPSDTRYFVTRAELEAQMNRMWH